MLTNKITEKILFSVKKLNVSVFFGILQATIKQIVCLISELCKHFVTVSTLF